MNYVSEYFTLSGSSNLIDISLTWKVIMLNIFVTDAYTIFRLRIMDIKLSINKSDKYLFSYLVKICALLAQSNNTIMINTIK